MLQYICVLLLVSSALAEGSDRLLSRSFYHCSKNTSFTTRCSDDCKRIEYCVRGKMMSIGCSELNGKEFCNPTTHACSDSFDTCSNTADYCPGDGTWPNLNNCSRYFHCEDGNVMSYECEFGTVYNFYTKRCEYDFPCTTYTRNTGCRNNAVLAPHANPNWFVFCSGWLNPLLATCDVKSYSFNPDTGDCEFKCGGDRMRQNGKYADERDPSIYYNCYKRGQRWITEKKSCPNGIEFSEAAQVCTKKSYVQTTSYPKPEPED